MERLTTRTGIGILAKESYGENAISTLCQCFGDKPNENYSNCDEGYCAMEKLADYEDAEEQGLLLRLRCNVGDTVYTVSENGVFSYVIQGFQFFNNEIYVLCGYKAVIEMEKCFFCIEEAEAKLEEMRGEQHEQ